MARYEHLPTYKVALDMTVHFEKLAAGFSLDHKYTLGSELRQESRSVLQQVFRANSAGTREQRATELLELRDHIDALLLAIGVAKEVRALAATSHRFAI